MDGVRKYLRLAALIVGCLAAQGCKRSTEQLKVGTETYSLKGTVVSVDAERGELVLQHDAVPGFMGAMTMPYKLVYSNSATEFHRGDVIRARLLVEKTADGDYSNARLDELAVLGQARPDFKPQSNYHVPTPGDAVPNFRFVNQNGQSVNMETFRGNAVLITFIYTRCPLGDFCPRMSRNFAEIDAALRKDPAAYAHTKLLSLSFDPIFDTPEVLKAYGTGYTSGAGFGHWQFAAPAAGSLQAVEHYFNLGATGSGASLTHSLSTVLVGPDGKIAAWYPGNEWQPAQVADRMKSLAAVPANSRAKSCSIPGMPVASQPFTA